MIRKLLQHIKEKLIDFVISEIAVGGHCGLCGQWVETCLVSRYWRVTICDECAKAE